MFRRVVCSLMLIVSWALLLLSGILFVAAVVCGAVAVVLAILSSVPEPLTPAFGAAAVVCALCALGLLLAAVLVFFVAGGLAIAHVLMGCPSGIDFPGIAGASGFVGSQNGAPFPWPFPSPDAFDPRKWLPYLPPFPPLPGFDPAKWLACMGASIPDCGCEGKSADPTRIWDGLWSKFEGALHELQRMKADLEEKRRALQAYADRLGDAAPQPLKDALTRSGEELEALDRQRQELMSGAGQVLTQAMSSRRP